MEDIKIRFEGQEYLLIGDKTDGAIATREQFENFDLSYAHLFSDGKIRRFNVVIGTLEDIEFI
jgi:hypothetical protein